MVAWTGTPPAAGTRNNPDVNVGAKRITPSRFQVPPTPGVASQRIWGGPPEAAIFFSFPCAKKPMNSLSGDQNGKSAPSVPGMTCAWSESRARSHSPSPATLLRRRLAEMHEREDAEHHSDYRSDRSEPRP